MSSERFDLVTLSLSGDQLEAIEVRKIFYLKHLGSISEGRLGIEFDENL